MVGVCVPSGWTMPGRDGWSRGPPFPDRHQLRDVHIRCRNTCATIVMLPDGPVICLRTGHMGCKKTRKNEGQSNHSVVHGLRKANAAAAARPERPLSVKSAAGEWQPPILLCRGLAAGFMRDSQSACQRRTRDCSTNDGGTMCKSADSAALRRRENSSRHKLRNSPKLPRWRRHSLLSPSSSPSPLSSLLSSDALQ